MRRRRYLSAAATAAALGFAGCGGGSGDGNNTSDGGDTEAGGGETTEPSTETEAPTETTVATETSGGETTGMSDTTMAETETEGMSTETMMETETEMSTETSGTTEMETETTIQTETTASSGSDSNTSSNVSASSGGGGGFSETFSGNGTSTVEGLELSPGPVTAEFTVGGEGYYSVTLVTLEGESFEDVFIVDGVISGEGSQVKTATVGGGYNLNVDIEGDWEVTIKQPANPQPESLPIDASGTGMDYVGPFEFSGPTTFQGTHDGEANFIVDAIPVDPSAISTSVFNEIEQFEGETTARVNGLAYVNVVADGEWTLSTG